MRDPSQPPRHRTRPGLVHAPQGRPHLRLAKPRQLSIAIALIVMTALLTSPPVDVLARPKQKRHVPRGAAPTILSASTTLISRASGTQGVLGNSVSTNPSVSSLGQYVAFASLATNLVSQSAPYGGAFVRDRRDPGSPTTSLASFDSTGNSPGAASHPSITRDGRYVAFETGAALIPQDTNGVADIYVLDQQSQTISLASMPNGVPSGSTNLATGPSSAPTIAGAGRYVVFQSSAPNLVANDTNTCPTYPTTGTCPDVFRRDLQTNATVRVSTTSTGGQANGQSLLADTAQSVSDDGTRFAFMSAATNLVSGDTNGQQDVFFKNGTSGTINRMDLDSSGNQGPGGANEGVISGSGQWVAFVSSDALVSTDMAQCYTQAGDCLDVYVRWWDTTQVANITLVSVDSTGNQKAAPSELPTISYDGRKIAWDSSGNYAIGYNTNGWFNVFLRDLQNIATQLESVPLSGSADNHSVQPFISPDGRFVAFQSKATNLVDGDTNGFQDVFVRDSADLFIPPGQTFGSVSHGTFAINPSRHVAEPVDTATGSFFSQSFDLQLPGVGIPFLFARSYNSADSSTGPLGPGWTHSYNTLLSIQWNGDALFRSGDGQQVYFTKLSNGSFSAGTGGRSSLTAIQGGWTLTNRNHYTYTFDTAGRVTAIKDRNNQGLTFAYSAGQLTSIIDSVQRTITLSYTGGLLSIVTLPDGRFVQYGYTSGRLTSVQDVRGGNIQYGYTGGLLSSIIDQDNKTIVQNVYGSDGRVIQQTDGRQNVSYFAWNSQTNTATYTDARNHAWQDVYSGNFLVKRIDPLGNTWTYTYDSDGNMASVTDAGNNNGSSTINYTYDASGNLIQEDDPAPLSYVKNWTYNTFNQVTSYTDGRSPRRTTRWEYDANGNMTCELLANAPAGVTTCAQAAQANKATYTYDTSGNGLLKTVTDPNGNSMTYGYDTQGNLSTSTGPPTPAAPQGSVTTMTYDSGGRLLTRVDPRGNVPGGNPSLYTWDYTFDNANQLTSVQDPLGNTWSRHYYGTWLLKDTTTPRGYVTRYEYDGNYNLTCLLYPDASVTTCAAAPQANKTVYAYDAANNPTSRADGNNHTWAYGYDNANRLHTVTSPLSVVWTYDYYADGLLQKKTLPSGNITYTYDRLNRPTGVTYSNTPTTPNVTYGYDANDNRTSMTDGAGSISYVYDDLNRMTSTTRGSDAFSYQYWAGGQTKQITYPDSSTVNFAFYADNTLYTVTGTATTTYTYDPAGNPLTRTLPSTNGYVATMTYDYAGRITGVTNAKSGVTLSSFTYTTIDADGDPTQIVTNAETQNYTYDAFDRTATACYPTCTGGSKNGFAYTYDPAGNIIAKVAYTPSADTTTTYRYNNDDQLCWSYTGSSSNACGSPPGGAKVYAFQANGNETQAGFTTFSWDLENRMLTATVGAAAHTYSYDGDGNRILDSWGSQANQKTNYQWDVNEPVALLAMERDGNNALLRRYTYGGGLISMKMTCCNYYYVTDPMGSVANLTLGTGTTEWTYTYDPFGGIRSAVKNDPSAPANLRRYTGELVDDVDNLYDLRARMYDPSIGRFLSIDPLGFRALSPPEFIGASDTYAYATNRPMTMADPSGLFAEPIGPPSTTLMYSCRPVPNAQAYDYLLGWACPPPGFVDRFGYAPVAYWGPNGRRVGRPASANGNCSIPVLGGPDDFEPACRTHDYGYDLLRFGAISDRHEVDDLLLMDLQSECDGQGLLARMDCRYAADLVFDGLRGFGAIPGLLPP